MIIRDELWRSLRIPALIRKIDSDLRLSRALPTRTCCSRSCSPTAASAASSSPACWTGPTTSWLRRG